MTTTPREILERLRAMKFQHVKSRDWRWVSDSLGILQASLFPFEATKLVCSIVSVRPTFLPCLEVLVSRILRTHTLLSFVDFTLCLNSLVRVVEKPEFAVDLLSLASPSLVDRVTPKTSPVTLSLFLYSSSVIIVNNPSHSGIPSFSELILKCVKMIHERSMGGRSLCPQTLSQLAFSIPIFLKLLHKKFSVEDSEPFESSIESFNQVFAECLHAIVTEISNLSKKWPEKFKVIDLIYSLRGISSLASEESVQLNRRLSILICKSVKHFKRMEFSLVFTFFSPFSHKFLDWNMFCSEIAYIYRSTLVNPPFLDSLRIANSVSLLRRLIDYRQFLIANSFLDCEDSLISHFISHTNLCTRNFFTHGNLLEIVRILSCSHEHCGSSSLFLRRNFLNKLITALPKICYSKGHKLRLKEFSAGNSLLEILEVYVQYSVRNSLLSSFIASMRRYIEIDDISLVSRYFRCFSLLGFPVCVDQFKLLDLIFAGNFSENLFDEDILASAAIIELCGFKPKPVGFDIQKFVWKFINGRANSAENSFLFQVAANLQESNEYFFQRNSSTTFFASLVRKSLFDWLDPNNVSVLESANKSLVGIDLLSLSRYLTSSHSGLPATGLTPTRFILVECLDRKKDFYFYSKEARKSVNTKPLLTASRTSELRALRRLGWKVVCISEFDVEDKREEDPLVSFEEIIRGIFLKQLSIISCNTSMDSQFSEKSGID